VRPAGGVAKVRMKTGRRVLVAAACVLLLGVTGAALAPVWINLDPVRKRIESVASSGLGGAVTVGRIDLSFFPRPGVVIHQLNLAVPGKVCGTVRSVSVSPVVLALLRGRFRPASVRVDGPDLTVELPETTKKDASASLGEPAKSLAPLLTRIASEVPGLVVEVNGERVHFSRGGKTLASVEGLTASVRVLPEARGRLHADVGIAVASVSLRRENRPTLAIDGVRIDGAFDSHGGKSEITLSRVSMESPRFLAGIALSAVPAVPRVELSARGGGLDVTALRGKLLPFAGDDPTVAAIFEIFRGGTLTSFTFSTGGRTREDLGVFERMSIRAVLAEGSVRIGSAGLDLEEARGDVAIEKGMLSVEHAAARIGKSQASDGNVRVGLSANDDTLRIEAAVRSDLAELPGILSRAVRGGSFPEQLPLLEELEGSAVGRITIENRAGGLRTTVFVSEMRLSGNYRKIPFPVSIRQGTFFYDGKRVGVGRLSGKVGRSTFSGLEARLRLGDSPHFEGVSGTVEASLDELYPWLASREGMEALRTEIRRLRGSVVLSVARLTGPISRPGEWRYEATGSLQDLLLDASLLSKALEVGSGDFRIDEETIRVSGLQTRTIDAALQFSGTLDGYRRGPRRLEAVVDGEMGPEAVRWAWEKASLPADLRPAAPIALEKVRLSLAAGGAFSLAGGFTVRDGPGLTLDLTSGGEGTDVRRLTIADDLSDASISLGLRKREFEVRFAGHLAAATLEALLAERRRRHGRIEGEFRALVRRDRLGETSADGWLKVANLVIPTQAGDVTVESLDLRASGNRLTAASSSVLLDEQRFSVTGGAAFREEGLILDMEAATDALTWERVEAVLDRMERKEEKAAATKAAVTTEDPAPPLRVLGDVHFSLGSFAFRNLVWKPVLGGVRLEGETTTLSIREADICGISTTGSMRFREGGRAEVRARVSAAGSDIGVPLACLGVSGDQLTGAFGACLEVEGEGEAAELPWVIRGPVMLKASKGRIGKATLLTKILGVLHGTSVFAGKGRDQIGKAMSYDTIGIEGSLESGRVAIREGMLRTPSLTLAASGTIGYVDRSVDLMVLAHPFSTTDKIIRAIPVVRYILGRDFLSVAATVTGSLEDPKIGVAPARDVSRGLVDILARTVTLPVKVVDPESR
jgi:hypothetical protein